MLLKKMNYSVSEVSAKYSYYSLWICTVLTPGQPEFFMDILCKLCNGFSYAAALFLIIPLFPDHLVTHSGP